MDLIQESFQARDPPLKTSYSERVDHLLTRRSVAVVDVVNLLKSRRWVPQLAAAPPSRKTFFLGVALVDPLVTESFGREVVRPVGEPKVPPRNLLLPAERIG